MALRAGCTDPKVMGLVSLGTPVAAAGRSYSYDFLHACSKPKLLLSGSADEFGPVPGVEAIFETAAEPKQLIWVGGADHFFVGRLAEMQAALQGWTQAQLTGAAFGAKG